MYDGTVYSAYAVGYNYLQELDSTYIFVPKETWGIERIVRLLNDKRKSLY